MQLGRIGNNALPYVLTIGMTVSTSFMYADIDQASEITPNVVSCRTNDYLKFIGDSEERYSRLKRAFELHYDAWRKSTMILSSAQAIVNNQDFQNIVSMGEAVVPFIVEKIDREPSTLVWALNQIYNKKITNRPNVTITEACKLWVKELMH